MSLRREPVHLLMEGEFVVSMRRAAEAAKSWSDQWALDAATWEPHDWKDWA